MAPSGHRRNLHPKSQASNYLFMKLTSFRFYRIIIKSKSNYRNRSPHPKSLSKIFILIVGTGDRASPISLVGPNTAVFGINVYLL